MTPYADRAKTREEWIFRAEKITYRYLRWKIYQVVKHYKIVTPYSIEAAKMAAVQAIDRLVVAGYVHIDALASMEKGEMDGTRH